MARHRGEDPAKSEEAEEGKYDKHRDTQTPVQASRIAGRDLSKRHRLQFFCLLLFEKRFILNSFFLFVPIDIWESSKAHHWLKPSPNLNLQPTADVTV